MANLTLRGGGDDPSVVMAASSGPRSLLIAVALIISVTATVALLVVGGIGGAVGFPFVGIGILGIARQLNKYTAFRREVIVHRGVWAESSASTVGVARIWFELGGGTVVIQFRDRLVSRFQVGERAIGPGLREQRASVVAALVETIGAPYAGITTADPPPHEPALLVAPLSRMDMRFARLLPSEWAVVIGTVVLSAISLFGSRS
jgi:hypothetical protein